MRRSAVALLVLCGVAIGVVIGFALAARVRPAASAPLTTRRSDAVVLHQVIAREGVRVDLYLPAPAAAPAPWMVFAHERGWPAPDEKEREGAGIADAMQRRGIAVAVVSFDPTEAHPLREQGEHVAEAVRELARRSLEYGMVAEPVLAGHELGASLVTSLALDPHYGLDPRKLRGVIAMNGIYDEPLAPLEPPPFLVLASHGDSPRAAQSSRALARALERAGAKEVHGYYVGVREGRALSNLSGERNDVGDVVAAFVRREVAPGGAEGPWALADTWGAHAPLSTEPFWASDEPRIVRRPTDARFRAAVRNVFGEMMRDLEPWPALTYDAIDLGAYLAAHPELGTGDWLEMVNARGEKVVLARREIERKKPVIVVGIDDERNLFRLFVTYDVHRTYSWKPETEPRPLLARHVGAFLYVPSEAELRPEPRPDGGALHVTTMADFALTAQSFRLVAKDPLASARNAPKLLGAALTNEQGCLQCHTLHGEGGRAHHLRAHDGHVAEAHGLALEEYPNDVLRRFLFEQDAVAKSFGVGPLKVDAATARLLLAEASR